MKAYTKCPKCGRDNNAVWLKEITNKPYITCICVECNNVYNQLLEILDTKSRIIKPDHIDPVLRITTIDYPDLSKDLPPGKPVRKTTSQARINSD